MRLEVRGISTMTQKFIEVWGMYVNDFDPSKHCQDCLKGERATILDEKLACLKKAKDQSPNTNVSEPVVVELSDTWPYFYLFAWGYKPKRATNVHLAVRYQPGSVASVGSAYGVTFTIHDAFAPRIDRLPEGWMGLPKGHATCRNFQFGVQMFGYHPKVEQTRPGDFSLPPQKAPRDTEQST